MQVEHKAKQLSLEEVKNEITKPIRRQGDLVLVHGRVISTFMPSLDISVMDFDPDSTIAFLDELYSSGGHIASLKDLSDEALALAFDHKGGIIADGIAGSVGDSADFVKDVSEQLDAQPAAAAQAIRQAVLAMHQKYKLKATKFAGRKKDSKGKVRLTLEKIMAEHPGASTIDLRSIADKQNPDLFLEMPVGTFNPLVSIIRGKIKKTSL